MGPVHASYLLYSRLHSGSPVACLNADKAYWEQKFHMAGFPVQVPQQWLTNLPITGNLDFTMYHNAVGKYGGGKPSSYQ